MSSAWPFRATSSGTGGTRSRIGLEWNALGLGARMGIGIGKAHGLFSLLPANCLISGYQPSRENQTAYDIRLLAGQGFL